MLQKVLASIKERKISMPSLNFYRHRAGIQIGEKAIKIVEVKKEKDHWETIQTIVEELPNGMVKEGKILQPEFLGLKIQELFTDHKITVKKVSVFIEELPFFIRTIHLPKMSKKEREKAIYYNTQLEIPVDPSELTIRYTSCQYDSFYEGDQDEYIIFAVYSSYIKKAVQAIHTAGLSVYTFGLEPDAIYQGLQEKNMLAKTDAPNMIVRTDTNRMLLAIYNNEKLVYSRYVPFSLNKQEWRQEIQRTLISWNGKNQNKRIGEVLLLGEEDHWEEVKQQIGNFLPLSVRLVTSPFTACLGISLKSPAQCNFYRDKHFPLSKKLSFTAKIIIPTATIITVILLYVLIQPLLLKVEIIDLQEKVSQPYKVTELVNKEESLRSKFGSLSGIKDSIEEKQVDILELISGITVHQPEKIIITQLLISEDTINLNGEGSSQEDVVLFLKGLQKNPQFENVSLTGATGGLEKVQFTIEISKNLVSEDQDNAKIE